MSPEKFPGPHRALGQREFDEPREASTLNGLLR